MPLRLRKSKKRISPKSTKPKKKNSKRGADGTDVKSKKPKPKKRKQSGSGASKYLKTRKSTKKLLSTVDSLCAMHTLSHTTSNQKFQKETERALVISWHLLTDMMGAGLLQFAKELGRGDDIEGRSLYRSYDLYLLSSYLYYDNHITILPDEIWDRTLIRYLKANLEEEPLASAPESVIANIEASTGDSDICKLSMDLQKTALLITDIGDVGITEIMKGLKSGQCAGRIQRIDEEAKGTATVKKKKTIRIRKRRRIKS